MTNQGPRRITVLFGGDTGERSVSLRSGIAVAAALVRRGHQVQLLDPATGRGDELALTHDPDAIAAAYEELQPVAGRTLRSLAGLDPGSVDAVAILLHGGSGEGGRVQAVLELAGIPYTGSGPEASALAMDKVLAKRLMRSAGIPLAEEVLWGWTDDSDDWDLVASAAERAGSLPRAHGGSGVEPQPPAPPDVAPLGGYPVVVKPIAGGSTLGVTIVRGPEGWSEAWWAAGEEIDPQRGLLVERFIPGRELTVGILEGRTLPVVEIVPKSGFYDYRRKYTKGETEYLVPAELPGDTARRLQEWAGHAFTALGCRDMGRVDFRLAPDGSAVCLEVNTIPGMTATSLLPMAAAAVGIGFDDLVEILCRKAWGRRGRITDAGTGVSKGGAGA